MERRALKMLLGLTVLSCMWFDVSLSTASVKELVIFGDSLLDTGIYWEKSAFLFPPSGPGKYFSGRASNGPVYSELLAGKVGLPLKNFAVSGGTACIANELTQVFPFADSVEQIVSDQVNLSPAAIDWNHAAVLIAIGPNDLAAGILGVVNDPNLAQTVANCILEAAGKLLQKGVLRLALQEVVPLETSPIISLFPPAAGPQMQTWREAISVYLAAGLTQLKTQCPKARLQIVSLTATWLDMVAHPDQHALTDSTTTCISCDDPTILSPFLCVEPANLVSSCNEAQLATHMFFDTTHPTTASHEIFATTLNTQMTAADGILK